MRKFGFLLLAILLFSAGFAFNLSVKIPEYMHANSEVNSTIIVNSSEKFDIVILLPKDFSFVNQKINTSEFNYWFEYKRYNYEGKSWIGLHWHIRKPGNYSISFVFTTPNVDRLDKYEVIYTTESGEFGKNTTLIRVYTGNAPPPICGNGVCEPGENAFLCPSDCGGVISYVMDILIIVGVSLTASSIMIWYLKKQKFERSIMGMYNIDKLIAYIRSAMKAKIPEWRIKQELYKMGWEPKVVDYLIKKIKRENQ